MDQAAAGAIRLRKPLTPVSGLDAVSVLSKNEQILSATILLASFSAALVRHMIAPEADRPEPPGR
jgi:hypothetical protein